MAKSLSDTHPVVNTSYGPVRGVAIDGVNIFKGVRYGAPAGGDNRFRPARPPEPWTEVCDALEYGAMAMQPLHRDQIYQRLFDGLPPPITAPMSEDCLFLNVWTSGLAGKHPVMVWLHPGGWKAWSGESKWCDGARLAQQQDVVMVSVNHRLNVFGHLYLAEIGGADYAESGNLSMLDIVLALEWVRDNIAAFGGDPDNVTLFGESGGAVKVSTILAMPAAQGLVHKAIIHSNAQIRVQTPKDAMPMTAQLMAALGAADIDALLKVPAQTLIDVSHEIDSENYVCPVVTGGALPRHPFEPDAPETCRDVTIMIGITADEMTYFTVADGPDKVTDDESAQRQLSSQMGYWGLDDEEALRMIRAWRRLHPDASPIDCFASVGTHVVRDDALVLAELKNAQGGAPAFMYLFNWGSPAFGGRYRSCHTFELPFAFDNLEASPQLFGPDPDRQALQGLADNMSRAWATFARTGNPSHAGIGPWAAYDPETRRTMIFDVECGEVADPMRDERLAFLEFRTTRLAKRAKGYVGLGESKTESPC